VGLLWDGLVAAVGLILRADPELWGIAALSLGVSGAATALASLIGVPLGVMLHLKRFRGRRTRGVLINTGMGLPPVVVGLVVMLMLWRTGPFGALGLLYTPWAMVLAQLVVALPLVAGFTRSALGLLDPDLVLAMRADGASDRRVGFELSRAAGASVLVAVAAGLGRAISEVGASLMVGGNIVGQTRILTTAIALESSRGEFALAIALGIVLLLLALLVNAALGVASASGGDHTRTEEPERRGRGAPAAVLAPPDDGGDRLTGEPALAGAHIAVAQRLERPLNAGYLLVSQTVAGWIEATSTGTPHADGQHQDCINRQGAAQLTKALFERLPEVHGVQRTSLCEEPVGVG